MSEEDIESVARGLEKNIEIKNIPLVNGFCCVMRKSLFKKLNGFLPQLTAYGNEKEIQIRMRKLGYRTCLVCGAYVHHLGKCSYSKENLNISQCQRDSDREILRIHGRLE